MVQESESKIGVYVSSHAQLIPEADEKSSESRKTSAEKKKQQAKEPLYLYRL